MAWWDSLLSAAIPAAVNVGGALLSSNANQNAAETAARSNERAAQIQADAQREGYAQYKALVDQAMAEATAYNQRAQGMYRDMGAEARGEYQPAAAYLRQVAYTNPADLTPSQQQGLEDTRRSANANLAASGLRGAGRAGVATLNEAERRYRNAAYDSNLRRSDSAANTIYGTANANAQRAGYAEADTERATGSTRANMLGQQGNVARDVASSIGNYSAGLTRDTGQTSANADLASAQNWGSALGALGSIFANEVKNRSNYGNYNPGAV